MTTKKYESSAMDKKMDKSLGVKENSKKDILLDKKKMNMVNTANLLKKLKTGK